MPTHTPTTADEKPPLSALKHVLVIEDNPGDARLVRGYLDERFGPACAVRQAATLAAGLDALRAEAADVVLLDLGLPDSQGLASFFAVQRAAPGTAVVILTGNDDQQLALQALGTGAEDSLAKADTDSVTLLRAMHHALQRRQFSAGLRSSQARLTERTVLLEQSNTELRTLNRVMAHDLRSPLNGIIGMTRLVAREAEELLSTTAWRRLQLVEHSALEMNTLIERLMELTVLRQQDVERETLDLSAMAGSIAERLNAAQPERRVRWQIGAGLSASGDRALVNSVLQNLLDNAWKYTGTQAQADIELGCERIGDAEPVFFVRDNGVGFDPAQVGRLFAAFERLPTSAGHAGTGLGLFSARHSIERHGGAIWAESAAGAGAVFRFTLGQAPRGR